MEFPMNFICAGPAYSTLTEYVAAPYFRKSFQLNEVPETAGLWICGLGFYELYINGHRITKGLLSPYISNPDDLLYYDDYELSPYLSEGENVVGVWLGNGFQNDPGGYIWDFDKARFRGAPELALRLHMIFPDGNTGTIESDETFRTAPSPVYNDDYRNGEYYDARREIPGWNAPGFDDSTWRFAEKAPLPRGEAVATDIVPIAVERELSPISVEQTEEGFLYDFGEDNAGVCRFTVQGYAGQVISLYHAEMIRDGKLDRRSISFDENDYVQKDIYICKGGGVEQYTPTFTYHGFRYVLVKGIEPEQATKELLTYLVLHTALRERGGFSCSDPTANALQDMVRRSTLSNFHHFPTDCPQREKNGWTGDASLSAEHTLLNLEPDKNYREWLRNIRKAQADDGSLPGIVPTAGWGFAWGNGAAWDSVLFALPYYLYIYRHDRQVVADNAHAMIRYLDYLTTKIESDGLIHFGLGDWFQVWQEEGDGKRKSPVELTNTVLSMDMCEKAAFLFGELGMPERQAFAHSLYTRLKKAGRERLIDRKTMTALGDCQTSQAVAIYYSLFNNEEKPAAFQRLLELVHKQDDHMDVGIIGGRVLFHVLSEFGRSDLAYHMIVRPDYPSYGEWVKRGLTTLREDFYPEERNSLNHHMWGDISNWFMTRIVGIRYAPHRVHGETDICPAFIRQLDHAQAWHKAPEGRIAVRWERRNNDIHLSIEVPNELHGRICLPAGYRFADDKAPTKPLLSGEYTVNAVNEPLV